ncbi:MAG: type II secretion system protein GspG [Polyangiaceae bacterium]
MRLIVTIVVALSFILWLHGREEHSAGVRATRATITTASSAILSYRADHSGKCPPALEDLVRGGYLRDLPLDAWGHSLRLTCPGRRDAAGFDLESDGPDGVMGGLDRVD